MPAHFTLDRFERIEASPTTALLRLSGHWSVAPGPAAEIVVGDTRLAPLPGPPAAEGQPWRAAYPVPTELLDAHLDAIALGTGLLLGAPVAVGEPMPTPPAARVAKLERQVAGLEAEAVLLRRECSRAVATHDQLTTEAQDADRATADAQATVAALRAELEECEAGLATAFDERDALETAAAASDPGALDAERAARTAVEERLHEREQALALSRKAREALDGALRSREAELATQREAQSALEATLRARDTTLRAEREAATARAADAEVASSAAQEVAVARARAASFEHPAPGTVDPAVVAATEAREAELFASAQRISQLEQALRDVIAEEERHLATQSGLELRLEQAEAQLRGTDDSAPQMDLDHYADQPDAAAASEELELLHVELESLRLRAERGDAAIARVNELEGSGLAAAAESPEVLVALVDELEGAVRQSAEECATLNARLTALTRERDEMAATLASGPDEAAPSEG